MFLLKCIKSKASVQNKEPFRWIGFFEVAFPWHDINFFVRAIWLLNISKWWPIPLSKYKENKNKLGENGLL